MATWAEQDNRIGHKRVVMRMSTGLKCAKTDATGGLHSVLLGCGAASFGEQQPAFQRSVVPSKRREPLTERRRVTSQKTRTPTSRPSVVRFDTQIRQPGSAGSSHPCRATNPIVPSVDKHGNRKQPTAKLTVIKFHTAQFYKNPWRPLSFLFVPPPPPPPTPV